MIILSAAVRQEVATTARLAGPLIGGQLAYLGMAFVDTVMAGNLSAETLAAVALGGSVFSSLHLFVLGVLLALPPFVSEYEGRESPEARAQIAPFARQVGWVAVGLSALAVLAAVNLAPLLRAVGIGPELIPVVMEYLSALAWGIPAWSLYLVLRFLSEGLSLSRPTLYFGVLGLPANALANYALMYGHFGFPPLGAAGCGYATALVWWLQLCGFALYVARHPRYRGLALFDRLEPPHRETIARILKVGVPIAVAVFMEGSLFTIAALAVGSLGTVPMAGHQVALNFAALTFMIPLGISMAVTVRVGNAVGRGDPQAVRFRAAVGVGIAMACQLGSASLMLLLPGRIAAIYTDNPAVAAIAVELLLLAALFQLSDGLQVSCAGALRGIKDTRLPMLLTAVSYWLVGFPVGWAAGFAAGWGARGIWMGLIAGLTTAAVLLAVRLHRISHRPSDWLNAV